LQKKLLRQILFSQKQAAFISALPREMYEVQISIENSNFLIIKKEDMPKKYLTKN